MSERKPGSSEPAYRQHHSLHDAMYRQPVNPQYLLERIPATIPTPTLTINPGLLAVVALISSVPLVVDARLPLAILPLPLASSPKPSGLQTHSDDVLVQSHSNEIPAPSHCNDARQTQEDQKPCDDHPKDLDEGHPVARGLSRLLDCGMRLSSIGEED